MIFYIKQKVLSIKDKFDVYDEQQNLEYQVKGRFMSISNKLELLDLSGEKVLSAHRKVLSFLPTYYVYDLFNDEIATIKKKFSFRPKFDISALGKNLFVDGSLFGHSFTISDETGVIASIEKRIISWGDTYEIEILDEENKELFLFVVIIIDQVIHERRNR